MSESTEQTADDFLHIYGQVTHHDDALIVGTCGAIQKLRDACDRALKAGEHEFDAFASDGEGYNTMVRIVADVYVLDELPTHYIENCFTVKWERTRATDDALERAAQLCHENMMFCRGKVFDEFDDYQNGKADGAEKCADEIRAMKVPT